jgi:hypothetical protein
MKFSKSLSMKKLLFITACFTCISITGLHAQREKGSAVLSDSVASNGSPSGAREGKNVGKGTPLLQRNSGGSGADKATAAPSEGAAAPAAPAEKKNDPKNTAPANNGGAKPKE